MIRRIRAWFAKSAPAAGTRSGVPWKRRPGLWFAVLALAGIAAAAIIRLYPASPLVFEAVLEGERRHVAAPCAGTVMEILVAPDQIVRAGAPLALVLPNNAGGGVSPAVRADLQNKLEAARKGEETALNAVQRAALAHTRAQLALYEAGAGADTPQDRQQRANLRAAMQRTAADLEAARSRHEAASAARRKAEDAYRQVREPGDGAANSNQPPPAAATAPQDGRIERLSVAAGTKVRGGQSLMLIGPVTAEQFWVAGYARPERTDELPPGRTLALRLVEQNLRLTGSVIATRPAEAGTEGKARAVPVRIRLDDYDPLTMPALQPGQKVTVSVN
jgi:multidrug resistance efflux pump